MRVYLDNCSLQRPLDDKSQVRIALEAEAMLGIMALHQQGVLEIVHSDALRFEIDRTPDLQRKVFAAELLKDAAAYVAFSPQIVARAKELEQEGIKPLDALHVACAEHGNVYCFCTCDDRLMKRLKVIASITIAIVTPLELIQEVLP
ncbi:PIN domain-containing protein [Candidatus Chloroploca sp. Khr17]|uniref:PIN domain-containing protein n=1 Tax=Candidatus Chloroploca sp. Khr17 TaxID=2496869 RepID=UPI00101C87D9|nr:PIN domain-containing protein [Candidatus Chloroploca sp. Khr17]